MTSRGYIIFGCWVATIMYWAGSADGALPAALFGSYVVLELLGKFKVERMNAALAGQNKDDDLNDRQREFRRLLEEGKASGYTPEEDLEEMAKIVTVDEEGNPSTIIIMSDGTIETTGEPDPDIIKAANMLKDSIQDYGPDAIVEELQKQLQKIDEEKGE